MVRTFKICSQQLSSISIALLTIVTVLYIRSSEFTLLITVAYTLWPLLPISHIPPTPGSHQYILCLWVQLFYIPHVIEIIPYLSFSVWLIWLSIVPWRFSCVVVNGRISSFLWLINVSLCIIFVCVYMHCILFIHSFITGHVGCFLVLAVVNIAAVNMRVQIPLQDSDFVSFG